MKNMRLFLVKFMPVSANCQLGDRIKITDLNRNKSVTFDYGYKNNGVKDQAELYLRNKGIKIEMFGNGGNKIDGYIMGTLDFVGEIK